MMAEFTTGCSMESKSMRGLVILTNQGRQFVSKVGKKKSLHQ
jgi:hypothetical protein